jgi:hypothetical protein
MKRESCHCFELILSVKQDLVVCMGLICILSRKDKQTLSFIFQPQPKEIVFEDKSNLYFYNGENYL